MRLERDRRLYVSHHPGELPSTPTIIVYDLQRECVDDLTAYATYLLRKKLLDKKTVLNSIYQIRVVKEFFLGRSSTKVGIGPALWDVGDVDDESLEEFRDHLLKTILADTKCAREMTAKRTVNSTLLAAYAWFRWLQATGRSDEFFIGAFPCRVLSERRQSDANRRGRERGRDAWSAPALFKHVGSASRHKLPGFVPDDVMRVDLCERFHESTASPFIAHRNNLLLQIANETGLRRGSVNSLSIDQFDRAEILRATWDFVDVQPSRQKFNYEQRFDFPVWLALQACDFIEKFRNPLLASQGWTEKRAERALFVSAKTGKPLQDRSISQIFGKAMRALGAPKGSAFHAWRHKFVGDDIEEETSFRLEHGLDTSVASISAVASVHVGHRSLDSLHPYVVSQQSRNKKNTRK